MKQLEGEEVVEEQADAFTRIEEREVDVRWKRWLGIVKIRK